MIVTITEKLTRLTKGKNKAELARRAGLKPTTISDYIAKEYAPRSDIALKMARALEVPVDWLIDDAQDWPPPPQQSVSALSTEDLAHELGRRMRPVGTEMFIGINRAQRADWVATAKLLLSTEIDAPLPSKVRRLIELPGELGTLRRHLRHYDPRFVVGEDTPPELAKDVQRTFETGIMDLLIWHRNLDDYQRGYRQAAALAGLFLEPTEYRPEWFAEIFAQTKAKIAAELAALPSEKPALPPSLSRKRDHKQR